MSGIGRCGGIDTSRIAEHVQVTLICNPAKATGRSDMQIVESHPMRTLYRDIIGIDTFAFAADEGTISEPWHERPHLCKTPA